MKFIADFHIHSKYSRATSKDMDVEHLSQYALMKGIGLLGTGDFTHHLWLEELKGKLVPTRNGLFEYGGIFFILTTEVCNLFSKREKGRRIHNVLFAPSFEVAEEINKAFARYGNLSVDGRPMLNLSAPELVKIVLGISKDCLVVPGHIWTPWFSLFGANSGFDMVEDCFEDQTPNIYALETGLSSDPAMNWRWSALDRFSLISNSDAHCIHSNTNIYTINGKPVAIKNLNPSNVLSIDLTGDLRQREGKISKLHKLPSPPFLYKITTRTKEIVTTPEHRFFVLENEEIIEKKASELKEGSLVACLRQISHKGKSKRLPSLDIDHEVKILPKGVDYLRSSRIKNKKTQKDIGEYIGVSEGRVWIFEKNKVKTPKESFINKYCECLGIDKHKFKKKFLIYRSPLEKFPRLTNEKFCQILGYILGDGGIERSKRRKGKFSFTDKNTNLLTYYRNSIKELFNIEGKLRKKQGNSSAVRYSAYLAEYFQKIDLKILAPSPERQIPEFVFGLPKKEIAAFLGGLFDAEGTNGHHSVDFTSSSLVLIKEVQALLLKFGLHSYIYPAFEKNKKRWRYRLTIYSHRQLKRFAEEIKFSCKVKKQKLLKYLSYLSKSPKNCFVDPLPLREEILKIKKVLAVSCYDIPKRLYYHLEHENTLKRENVREFIEILSSYLTKLPPQKSLIVEKLKRFAESDIIWESVQEGKQIKSDCEYVYDLTVPNYENYVANGFITHNSPQKIGREANVFECEMGYYAITDALKKKDKQRFLYTIEFFPQEGKYHYDGHRLCNVCFSPREAIPKKNICPVCGKRVTVGVMHRVEELSDRPEGFVLPEGVPFKNLIPLDEIIAEAKGLGVGSQAVGREYRTLTQRFGSEMKILLEVSEEELIKTAPSKIAKGILNVRQGKVKIVPGYDGVYGKINIFSEEDDQGEKQLSFF